ncbi:MAG: hypothetical protein NC204_01875 [Candidatus Amulumruptor caecigallinarius]|nr:hypothetical protein [Candidatus Amulumruptor caecigallinarius]
MKENISHISLVTKKYLTENRRMLLITAGSYLGFSFLIGSWMAIMGIPPSEGMNAFYMFLSGLACAIVASMMFSDLGSKEKRISVLMTPAKASDIFLVRLAAVLPCMILLVYAGLLLFNYSCILFIGMQSGYYPDFPHLYNFRYEDALMLCMGIAMFLFNESLFIFGAVAWPKKSFIKTLGIFALLQLVFSFIIVGAVKLRLSIELTIDPQILGWIAVGVITVIATGIIYLAYRKYKNIQVV